MARGLFSLAVCLVLFCAFPQPALTRGAGPMLSREVNLRPPPGLRSRSLRFPWDGRLTRGLRVAESEYVRHVPEYAPNGNFHGTWELAQLVERAARRVAFRVPGARLSIGELSRSGGGALGGHHSHTSGRDVDIGFYVTTPEGKPQYTYAFADFDANGRGLAPNGYLRFDDARNWELVAKLVTDGDARVQYIFVAQALRSRLLAHAERIGAPASVIERARSVLIQPGHGHPHRNHFHVRIYCPPADRPACSDRAPFWPWYPGQPPGGVYTMRGGPFEP